MVHRLIALGVTALAAATLSLLPAQQASALAFAAAGPAAAIDLPAGEHLLACGDFDGDGDPDLLVDGRHLWRNDSTSSAITLVNVTTAAGLAAARGPAGCWFDFDLDGRLDFGTTTGEVWLGDGKGRFVDFSRRLGISLPHGAASAIAWVDLDGDGWLDLFGGGDNQYDPSQHFAQSVWINSPRQVSLANLTRERDLAKVLPMRDATAAFAVDKLAYGRAVVGCDFDLDGDDDVYSGNYHLQENFLWRNDGGRLSEVGTQYGVAGRRDDEMFPLPGTDRRIGYRHGHTIGAAWADLDGDGYFDLFVANLVHKYVGPVSAEFAKVLGSDTDTRGYVCDDSNVFVNQGPPEFHFVDRRVAMGIPTRPIGDGKSYRGDELWSNVVAADFDNNGWVDVFCNQVYGHLDYSHGLLFCNDGGTFVERHQDAGLGVWGGYGAVAVDLDSDGRLDLVTSGAPQAGGAAVVRVFRNVSASAPWLGLRFGLGKGQQVVGTKVMLVQERRVQVRQLATTMGSHTQQGDGRVHFGIGDGGSVRDVIVYWPDGRMQSLGQPALGKYHEVKRTAAAKWPLRASGPAQAQIGQAVGFRIDNHVQGSRYDWDFAGSRLPEVGTRDAEVTHTFTQAGTFHVTVRGVRPGGSAAEARLVVVVTGA